MRQHGAQKADREPRDKGVFIARIDVLLEILL
jgi:hypothetical protein